MRIALGTAVALFTSVAGAQELPAGGTVTDGSATIGTSGSTMTINQSSARAIIDWNTFNVSNDATVTFNQPGSSSVAVNRVGASAGQSAINGALNANGHVMVLNPNGVMFGPNATVDVAGLIASTGNINDSQFMAGGDFSITGATTGAISNQGTITVPGSGRVTFVAPTISNSGTITAPSGHISLASANATTITWNGGLYEVAVDQAATSGSIANAATGTLSAAGSGGTITLNEANLLSSTINLEGVQQANTIVVHGDQVVLASDLNASTVSGDSNTVNVQSGAQIQDGVNIARSGGTVNVGAGNYAESLNISKALTLNGTTGAKLLVSDSGTGSSINGININGNNVTISNLEIAGPVDASYLTYNWGSKISRGIAVSNGSTGFTIANNNIHDIRNGILIDGRNNTGSVTGNVIENTKSGISIQYTDASGITISGNSEGSIGNEWGLNLHLNGFLDGGTIHSNPYLTAPSLDWQHALLDFSSNNGGWSVQDQGYTSSNRTQVRVATTGSAGAQGSLLTPIDTIQNGVNAVVTGGTVNVGAGTYTQASTLNVNKSVTLAGAGQSQTTIDARSVTGYGMSVSADDVTLRDFTMYGPSAFFPSAYGIKVSPGGPPSSRLLNFTIKNVTSQGAGKAELDLNGVNGALIDNVTADGTPVGGAAGTTTQGAGIQLTDSANITVRNSTTRDNAWGGLAIYQANRSYDQQATGITVENNNHFGESNPLYLQDESATNDFGLLTLPGFSYAVRNASTTDSAQYTFMQSGLQSAFNLAVALDNPASSYVQGWNGTALTQNFQVGVGNLTGGGTQAMSITTAINTANSGANINVAAGTYAENVAVTAPRNFVFNGSTIHSLTVTGSGVGIGGSGTADGASGFTFNAPTTLLSNTTLTTNGSDITLNADVQGSAHALGLVAGSADNRGDVFVTSGGTQSNPLGAFNVVARNYKLQGTLWVDHYTIDTTADVALSDHTLRALGSGVTNTINAVGNITGSTISNGSAQVVSKGNVSANVTAAGAAVVSGNNVQGNINAASAVVSGNNVQGNISANSVTVSAQQNVQVTLNAQSAVVQAGGNASLSGSAPKVTIKASKGGSLSGDFGQVSNVGDGLVAVNGKPHVNDSLADSGYNHRALPVETATGGDTATARAGTAASFVAVAGPKVQLSRVGPDDVLESLDQGRSVEIDLSPRNERQRQKK